MFRISAGRQRSGESVAFFFDLLWFIRSLPQQPEHRLTLRPDVPASEDRSMASFGTSSGDVEHDGAERWASRVAVELELRTLQSLRECLFVLVVPFRPVVWLNEVGGWEIAAVVSEGVL
jgi:hypothetical protein